ncbi:MAG: hypothetical protein R2697_00325 [Ilumatobacteraceae bacterium]
MKRASSSSSSILAVAGRPRRRTSAIVIGVGLAVLALGARGGGDDESEDTTPESTISLATTTTAVTTTTTPPSTTAAVPDEPEYVTEGDRHRRELLERERRRRSHVRPLAAVGFEMGTATNGTEGQLEVTKIYYDPANENALPVAESLREALGGGDIQVFEVGVPAPVDGGSAGDATVIVSMGNDTADKTLEQLQGRAPATTSADSGDDTTDTTEGSTDTTEPSTDTTEAG